MIDPITDDILDRQITINYRPIFRELGIAKSIAGCLLFHQLVYEQKDTNSNIICISDKELIDKMKITASEIRTARKDIINCGFVSYEVKGVPAKGYYTIDFEKLVDTIASICPVRGKSQTRLLQATSQFAGNDNLSIYTEYINPPYPPTPVQPAVEPSKPNDPKPNEAPLRGAAPSGRGGFLIPDELSSLEREILDFWNNHKGGRKTKQSWQGQMKMLLKIKNDPRGGIQAVKQQLQKAIEASEVGGRKWQAITFANWESYGTKSNNNYNKRELPMLDYSKITHYDDPFQ